MSITPFRQKPVKEGDVLEVRIDDVSKHGDGVAHVEQFVIFVREAAVNGLQTGSTVEVMVQQVRARFAVAKVIQ